MANVDLLTLIADDKQQISYRPRWNSFTGSVNATILLQQIIYRWVQKGRNPFYKFNAPCNNRAYRPGDSWQEETGLSLREFTAARDKIAQRISKDTPRSPQVLVWYWVDAQHKTWYALNEARLIAELEALYPADPAEAGLQAELPLDGGPGAAGESYPQAVGKLNDKSAFSNGADRQNVNQLNDKSAFSTDQQNVDQLNDKSAISTDRQNVNQLTTEITTKNTYKDNTKITPTHPPQAPRSSSGRAGAGNEPTIRLLQEFGVELYQEYASRPPELVQAWIWRVQEKEGGPGLLVYHLKGEEEPPAEYVELAGAWLAMGEDDRETIREAAGGVVDGIYQPPPPNGHGLRYRLPDGFYPDLSTAALHTYLKVVAGSAGR